MQGFLIMLNKNDYRFTRSKGSSLYNKHGLSVIRALKE